MNKEIKKFNDYLSKRIVDLRSTTCEVLLIEVRNKFNETFTIQELKPKKNKFENDFDKNFKELCSFGNNKSCLPALDNALLTEDGLLTVTDLEIYYQLQINIKDKKAIIPISILKTVGKLEAILDVEFDNITCKGKLITNRREMIFTSCAIDEFPQLPEFVSEKWHFAIMPEDLINAKKLMTFAGNNDLRPVMNGVYFGEKIVSTDAHKLAWFETKSNIKDERFIIDRKHIPFLCYGDVKTWYENKLSIMNKQCKSNWITIENPWKKIFIRTTEGIYPNFEAVIPKMENCPIIVNINKNDLIQGINDVLPFANKTTNKISFKMKDELGVISLHAEDLDIGKELKIFIETNKKVGDIEIAFNGKMMLSILKTIDESTITFSMSTPSRAIRVNENALIMPLMLEN